MSAPHREAIQKQIQQDWANREYIEVITISIKKITDFLNSFGKLKSHLKFFTLRLCQRSCHFDIYYILDKNYIRCVLLIA